MSNNLRILGISGSLRKNSYNTGLLRAAQAVLPADVTLDIFDLNGIPFYNGDEDQGDGKYPERVQSLRNAIADAHALLLATPEYNYSYTAVLKNALDWASRGKSPLNNKPLAMLGTGGMSGTMRAQFHLRQVLVHNDVLVMAKPELYIPGAWDKFDAEGNLTDGKVREQVRGLVEALVAWTQRVS